MKNKKRKTTIWLGGRDQERLDMIREFHDVSLSAILRNALRLASVKLGYEKGDAEDLLKK